MRLRKENLADAKPRLHKWYSLLKFKTFTVNTNDTATAEAVDLLDDKPQEIKADLRKFNKAEDQVNKALAALSTVLKIESSDRLSDATDLMKKAKQVETLIENKRKDLVKPFNESVKKINDYAKNLTGKIGPAIDRVKKLVLDYNTQLENERKAKAAETRRLQLVGMGFVLENGSYSFEGIMVPEAFLTTLDDASWSNQVQVISDSLEKKKQDKIAALNAQKADADFFGDDQEVAAIDQQIRNVAATPAAPVHVPAFGSRPSSGGSSSVKGITKTWAYEVEDLSLVPREYLMIDEAKVKEAIKAGTRIISGIKIFQKEGFSLR